MNLAKKYKYKYLLKLYSQVDEYLASRNKSDEALPEIVVSFCIVVEKVLKIALYRRNPLLIFNHSALKMSDQLIGVIRHKDEDIETVKIAEVVDRYIALYKNRLSVEEAQALNYIYKIRNSFIHGYKSDEKIEFNSEDIIKKMGTIWEKISKEAVSLFGKKKIGASKPESKYTAKELENILFEEVKKKINSRSGNMYEDVFESPINLYESNLKAQMFETRDGWQEAFSSNKCPRCGEYGFSKDFEDVNPFSVWDKSRISLYVCKKCNLELTPKEYELARRIVKNI